MPQEKNHLQVWELWGRERQRDCTCSLSFGIMWATPSTVKWWCRHDSARGKGWTLAPSLHPASGPKLHQVKAVCVSPPSTSFPQVQLTAELCPQQTRLEGLTSSEVGW